MRIADKIKEIEAYVAELEQFMPKDYKEYEQDLKTKAACERYFEKIMESVTDLCFLILKDNGFKVPEEDKQAFSILADEKIISEELAGKLKDAKGMRNILAHQYGQVDDEIVFESITIELVKDVKELLKQTKKSCL